MGAEYHTDTNRNNIRNTAAGPPGLSDERMSRTNILALALAAASDRGEAVFPLRDKIPAIKGGRGCKDASRERSRVHGMFNAAPDATGYGIATGSASVRIVVDVDGPEGRAEAERRGLTSGYVVRTGREHDGWHLHFSIPPGVKVRSRQLAPGLELKGEGAYVAGPGSKHPSGRSYRIVKGGKPSPAPAWLLEAEQTSRKTALGGGPSEAGPVVVDVAGAPIGEGERNRTMTRIAGRLHDGTRDLDTLTGDLLAVNDARCTPPLEAGEVGKVAASIYRRDICRPRPSVSPEVLAKVDYLQAAAAERPVRGMAGASGWSIYNAGLDLARRYGREHPDGVALSVDVRTWAQAAGTGRSTICRFVRRTALVRLEQRGRGRRSSRFVFLAPQDIRHKVGHSIHSGLVSEDADNCSVPGSALWRTLYRLRWGPGRVGKSRAAILSALVECSGPLTRSELAERLGRKPNALKAPLRWLVETGLLVRTGHGCYAAAPDLERRIQDERELGREPEADRLQIANHERERDGYRNRHRIKAQRPPSDDELRERRESYPKRRRAHIEQAIAALFANRPEYRSRRVGQITCQLVDYLAGAFPRGPDGLPTDAEVEAILDGMAA